MAFQTEQLAETLPLISVARIQTKDPPSVGSRNPPRSDTNGIELTSTVFFLRDVPPPLARV